MSESGFDFKDESPDQVKSNPLRAYVRKLESENKELRAKLLLAAEAQRKLAFIEAGVDLTSPATKYFVKGYDGMLTAEAIRAAAEEANIIPS